MASRLILSLESIDLIYLHMLCVCVLVRKAYLFKFFLNIFSSVELNLAKCDITVQFVCSTDF